ncbi:MAG: YbjN domain-containing protein [Actinomycetia bacterium]|nr:YbjN domain-containing protein [Actinomycetes bacterium]
MSDPTALPNFPPPPNEQPLRGLVIDALQDLKLEPNVDKEGDVSFKANDQRMFVRCLENDVKVLRVFGQWKIGEPVPPNKVMQLAVCNDLNLSMTMVKTGIGNDALVVTSEHMITDPKQVKNLLAASVQLCLATVQVWHERIMKVAEKHGGQATPGDEAGRADQAAGEQDQHDQQDQSDGERNE